jgi:hypothetical protein
MTWRLSPLIGDPETPFYFIRPSRDNFFVDAIHAFQGALGLNRVDLGLDIPVVLFCGGITLLMALAFGTWWGARQKHLPRAPYLSPQQENLT